MHISNKRILNFSLACGLIFLLPLAQAAGASQAPESTPDGYNGYGSVALGNGIIYGRGSIGEKQMRWRSAEIRFGPDIDLFGPVSSERVSPGESPRLDVVYYNEGHPDNNHRDGYALQMVFRKNLQPRLDVELGAGPYFSMNRTTVNGMESDDDRLGALLSLAFLVRLDQYSPGLNVRLAYNHVIMPGAPSSDALLVGIGKELDSGYPSAPDEPGRHPVWLAASGGFTQTNHSGPGIRFSYAVEAKKYDGQWATSVSGIEEGDDGVRVNRRGIALQRWYVQPIDAQWSISAGAGPYLAQNKRESDKLKFNGLMTIQVDRTLSNNLKAFLSFGRIVTFADKNDADLFTIGVMKRFNF